MDRGSSVIVTELERELPSMVLTEYAKRIARSLRPKVIFLRRSLPPTIAKMLKSEGIFGSRRRVAKFYQEYT